MMETMELPAPATCKTPLRRAAPHHHAAPVPEPILASVQVLPELSPQAQEMLYPASKVTAKSLWANTWSSAWAVPFADALGVVLSAACLVHCLFLPLLLPFLAMNSWLGEEHSLTHIVLASLILPITAWAARHGYQHHRKKHVAWLLLLGAAFITVGAFSDQTLTPAFGENFSEIFETSITTMGSILLVCGHIGNWRRNVPHTKQCSQSCQHGGV